jgi:Na+/melibiose symporter-like transporter
MTAQRRTASDLDDRTSLGNWEIGVLLAAFFAVLFALGGVYTLASDDHGHGSYEAAGVLLLLFSLVNIVLAVKAAQAGKREKAARARAA